MDFQIIAEGKIYYLNGDWVIFLNGDYPFSVAIAIVKHFPNCPKNSEVCNIMAKWSIIFLLIGPVAFCQQVIEGKIVDADTGEPVPFCVHWHYRNIQGVRVPISTDSLLCLFPDQVH